MKKMNPVKRSKSQQELVFASSSSRPDPYPHSNNIWAMVEHKGHPKIEHQLTPARSC